MAAASIRGYIVGENASAQVTHTVTFPAGIQVGDYFVGVVTVRKEISNYWPQVLFGSDSYTSNVSIIKFNQGNATTGLMANLLFFGIYATGTSLSFKTYNGGSEYARKSKWAVYDIYNHGMSDKSLSIAKDDNAGNVEYQPIQIPTVISPISDDFLCLSLITTVSEVYLSLLYPEDTDDWTRTVLDEWSATDEVTVGLGYRTYTGTSIPAGTWEGVETTSSEWMSHHVIIYSTSASLPDETGFGIYIPQNSIGIQ